MEHFDVKKLIALGFCSRRNFFNLGHTLLLRSPESMKPVLTIFSLIETLTAILRVAEASVLFQVAKSADRIIIN